jgi:ribonuclease P protein component
MPVMITDQVMTSANTRNRLPERLTRKSEFRRIARRGKRIQSGFLKIIYRPVSGSSGAGRIGYEIPDRIIKGAVGRNRVRRLLREAIRHWWIDITPGIDFILHVHAPPEYAHAGFVEAVLLKMLLDAGLMKNDAIARVRDRLDKLSREIDIRWETDRPT